MKLPDTMPNRGKRNETHSLDLPPCCPRSGNPQPGSRIRLTYEPDTKVLEVMALKGYIAQYQGGLKDNGEIILRDMEAMIDRIAQDCANAVGVEVRAVARLLLAPEQRMILRLSRMPESEVCS